MLTSSVEPTNTLNAIGAGFSTARSWRSPEYCSESDRDQHRGYSLCILQDRDYEENGPCPVFHG